LKVDVLLLD